MFSVATSSERRACDAEHLLQTLVEYKDWPALVALGLERPGEHGHYLEAVLAALARESGENPSSGADEYIRSILLTISSDAELSETLTPLSLIGTLQASRSLPLKVAKGFIREFVRKQQGKARFNAARIAELQSETEALQEEVERKRSAPLVRSPSLPLFSPFRAF
jgi:hypothetical protein